jgi:hypothetical protein
MQEARKAKAGGRDPETTLKDRYIGILKDKWFNKYGRAQSSFWFLEGILPASILPISRSIPRMVNGLSENEECPYWQRWQLQASMHLKHAKEMRAQIPGHQLKGEDLEDNVRSMTALEKKIEEFKNSYLLVNYFNIAQVRVYTGLTAIQPLIVSYVPISFVP